MNEEYVVITLKQSITSEESEKLEDKVAEILGELEIDAEVWSEVTGNTTVSKTE